MTAARRCLASNPVGDIRGHHAAGDVSHPAGHDGHQFGARDFGKKGTNRQRRFRLPHENAGSDVERFGAAGAHEAGHDAGGCLHDELHDPKVIEHCEEGRDEDDRRQRLKGEVEALGRILLAEIAKDK